MTRRRRAYAAWWALPVFGLLGCAHASAQPGQGVSKTEITLGTIQDLSGPAAALGRQLANGMQMRADEVNQGGGVNGRRVHLIVADNGGDSARAARAAAELAGRDRVFAILGQIGAAQNLAAMPVEFEAGVINFLPLTGIREMYEPPTPLKVAFWPSYAEQLRIAVPYLVAQRHSQHLCVVYQDDDYGDEIVRGAAAAARQLGTSVQDRVALQHPAPADMNAAVGRLRAAGCDMIILGIAARDAAALIAEAHRAAYGPDFVGSSALYGAVIQTSSGRSIEGLYGVHTVCLPYRDDASKLVRDWAAGYAAKFGEDPGVFAVYGYYIMDLFTKAAIKAGPLLNDESFEAVLQSTTFPRDMFGSPEFHVSTTDRLGSRKVRISRMTNGKWVPVTTLLDAPASEAAPINSARP